MIRFDDQLYDFKHFLEDICNSQDYENHKPYLLFSVMESYYEYISKVIDGSIECRETQHKRLERLKSGDKIESEVFEIMNKTRIIRNGFSHSLTYFPSDQDIIEYHKIVSPYTGPKTGSLASNNEKAFSLNNAIIQGYCVVTTRTNETLMNAVNELIKQIEGRN